MRPLVRVRRETPFDPRYLQRSELLWPLHEAAARLGPLDDFPPCEVLVRVFDPREGAAPVTFEPATPRARRREPLRPSTLYDGRITLAGRVPTRARCWHDFMNALVWGTFPASKRALHARQHRAIVARLEPGARVLPPTRTRELDALALLDEGGVIVWADDPAITRAALRARPGALRDALTEGRAEVVVFGHAIFESLVLGVSPAAVAALVTAREGGASRPLQRIDTVLSATLDDASMLLTPTELCRVDLGEATVPTLPRTRRRG